MTPEHAVVWERVEAFELDEPEARQPFSARLAEENGWTREHARRVVAEYKRFAFLSVASGHPVTPSEAIDEAWHLHLIYTRSYWKEFCPRVLGKALHHEPSRGNEEDERKYAGWYAQTWESYREFFGVEPPADIWPSPRGRAERPQAERTLPMRIALPLAVAAVGLAGCAGALGWPMDLAGPDFLKVFFIWSCIGFAAALVLKIFLQGGGVTRAPDLPTDDPVTVALVAEGPKRATETILADFVHRGLLKADPKKRLLIASADLRGESTLLERKLHGLSRGTGNTMKLMVEETERTLAAELRQCREQGWVHRAEQRNFIRWIVLLVALQGPLVGLLKIVVGMARGRPVGFLVVGVILTTVLACLIALRGVWRTRAGDAALRRLRNEQEGLKTNPLRGSAGAGDLLPLAVALYGASVLPAAGMHDLRTAMMPLQSGGSDGGSSCSSSSCGGGGGSGCGGCSSS